MQEEQSKAAVPALAAWLPPPSAETGAARTLPTVTRSPKPVMDTSEKAEPLMLVMAK